MQINNLEHPDEFVGYRFGNLLDKEIIGKIKKVKANTNYKYLYFCEVCSIDAELFPLKYFTATKAQILQGKLSCGCSKGCRWSVDQYIVRVVRYLKGSEYSFLYLEDKFSKDIQKKNGSVRAVYHCTKHGEQPSQTFQDILSGRKCRECRVDSLRTSIKVDDKIFIEIFNSTGNFPVGTLFKRSSKLTKPSSSKYRGCTKNHWDVYCPICDYTYTSLTSTLKLGGQCCDCGTKNSKLGYVYLVKDNGTPIAIKFGITKNKKIRDRAFRYSNILDMELLHSWKFENTLDCKRAEKEIKNLIFCGVVDREVFKDGHTETTCLNNLDFIVATFEKHGGIME